MIINDLIPGVRNKLRGRTDLDPKILVWLQNAINDLTTSYPFEELVVKGPLTNFIAGQAEYAVDFFGNRDDTKFTDIRSFFRYFSPVVTQPLTTTTTGSVLKARATSTVEPMTQIAGLPFLYAQSGDKLIFGFNPDQDYAVYMRYQRRHPFEINLGNSQIFMPPDWQQITEYVAAIEGCDYIGATDLGGKYMIKLHGDPKKQGDLGIIQRRVSQQERVRSSNERQMQPVVRKY